MPRLAGIEVRGISIGGIETCIELPELKLAFDIGRCPHSAVSRETVLFTHAHLDHMGGVASHAATRALVGMQAPTYVIPHQNVEAFRRLFEAWRRLDRSELAHELVALGPGEEWTLPCGLIARPFRSPHQVHCQGYGLWLRREKLKQEYAGLAGEEIRHLRHDQGVTVTEPIETPEVAFTGDSSIDVVENTEAVRRARLLIMEATFLDERVDSQESRSKGHTHLQDIAERSELFENEAILLTHFSPRYDRSEILDAMRSLPESLRKRVTPLLDGHRESG